MTIVWSLFSTVAWAGELVTIVVPAEGEGNTNAVSVQRWLSVPELLPLSGPQMGNAKGSCFANSPCAGTICRLERRYSMAFSELKRSRRWRMVPRGFVKRSIRPLFRLMTCSRR